MQDSKQDQKAHSPVRPREDDHDAHRDVTTTASPPKKAKIAEGAIIPTRNPILAINAQNPLRMCGMLDSFQFPILQTIFSPTSESDENVALAVRCSCLVKIFEKSQEDGKNLWAEAQEYSLHKDSDEEYTYVTFSSNAGVFLIAGMFHGESGLEPRVRAYELDKIRIGEQLSQSMSQSVDGTTSGCESAQTELVRALLMPEEAAKLACVLPLLHKAPIRCMLVSNSRCVFTSGDDGMIAKVRMHHSWTRTKGDPVLMRTTPSPHPSSSPSFTPVDCMIFHPKNDNQLICSSGSNIQIWDHVTGRLLSNFSTDFARILQISISEPLPQQQQQQQQQLPIEDSIFLSCLNSMERPEDFAAPASTSQQTATTTQGSTSASASQAVVDFRAAAIAQGKIVDSVCHVCQITPNGAQVFAKRCNTMPGAPLSMSTSGHYITLGMDNGNVAIFSVASTKNVGQLVDLINRDESASPSLVTAVTFHSQRPYFAAASTEGKVAIYTQEKPVAKTELV